MKLLTVEEAAERLGVGVRFVRRLIAERRIRIHKIGKHVRIAEADIDAFIAAGRIDPTEQEPRADRTLTKLTGRVPRSTKKTTRTETGPPRPASR